MHAILGAVLAATLGASSGTWALPADGASKEASSWPHATNAEMFDFTLYTYEADDEDDTWDVEVATSPATDPDGTLAAADTIDHYSAALRPGLPDDIFFARSNVDAKWLSEPGTYYWQAYYAEPGEPLETTPLQHFRIVPRRAPDPPDPVEGPPLPPPAAIPPAPPAPVAAHLAPRLTVGMARQRVRREIRRRTGRRPHRLRYACDRETATIFTCHPAWRDARFAYRGTLEVTSTVAGARSAFRGSRTRLDCARHCRRALRW